MKALFTLVLSGLLLAVNAQVQNSRWVMGHKAGLDFSGTDPTIFSPTGISAIEACASYYDSTRNLLLYSDGVKLYGNDLLLDSNELSWPVIIMDVDSFGNYSTRYFGSTTSNGPYFITFNHLDSILYYITISGLWSSVVDGSDTFGLRYSKLWLKSSGEVQFLEANIALLTDTLTEYAHIVRHANGRDWWILCRKLFSHSITEFLFSPLGVSGPFDYQFSTELHLDDYIGQMAFSKDGNRFAFGGISGDINLFNFDRCTGVISFSNKITTSDTSTAYGLAFSPSGNKLYATTASLKRLVQFDLSNQDDSIPEFPMLQSNYCSTLSTLDTCAIYGQLKLFSDKIYIAKTANYVIQDVSPQGAHTAVYFIDNPDANPQDLIIDSTSIGFTCPQFITSGLPSQVDFNLGPLVGSGCDTLSLPVSNKALAEGFELYPNPADEIVIVKHLHRNALLTVYDMTGKLIFEKQIETDGAYNFDVADWTPGCYAVRVLDPKAANVLYRKLHVMR